MAFPRIILASQSPRRRELLSLYGFPFEVVPSFADEENVQGDGRTRVEILARRKCDEVAERFPGALVIAADTLVCIGDEILGKPRDEQDAARMLRLLSGNLHQVHTGLCVRTPEGTVLSGADTSQVHFLPLQEDVIRRYIATGEPADKAGAYAVQGRAGVLIDRIEGSYSNVIGLPLALLTGYLKQAGIEVFEERM